MKRFTVRSVEIFLKCKYDQIYPDILNNEVILCPILHGDHWCLVAIFLKVKRMVYLDSLFQGVGAAKAFGSLSNFIECATINSKENPIAGRSGNSMSYTSI